MVTVPARVAPVLAVAEILTEPPPDTVAEVVSQLRLSLTDHLQELLPATATALLPPFFSKVTEEGCTEGELGHVVVVEPASWVTAMARPPMETVPDRAALVLAVTEMVTEPPPVTVDDVEIQPRLSVTDQRQELLPATATLVLPPFFPKRTDPGDTEGELGHGVLPAAWVTLTLRPPMVTVPVRRPPVFRPTEIETELPPDPRAGVVIQLRLSLTDQVQLLGPRTETLVLPPLAPNVSDVGDTLSGDPPHTGTPAWLTVISRSPISTWPERAEPVFRCTVTDTVPLPATRAGVAEIQLRSSDTE